MSTVPSHVPAVQDIILGKIHCCAKCCFSKLLGEQVRSARAMFTSKRSVDQRQWVLDYLNTHTEGKTVLYVIGKDSGVCEKALRKNLYSIFDLCDNIIPAESGAAFPVKSKHRSCKTDTTNSGNYFIRSDRPFYIRNAGSLILIVTGSLYKDILQTNKVKDKFSFLSIVLIRRKVCFDDS